MSQKTDIDLSGAPVFVVGMNGSGTTMMLDHLGHHPDLYGYRIETFVLPHYLLNQARYGDLSVDKNFLRLWNDMRSEFAFRRCNKGMPVELPKNWAEVARNPAAVFDSILLNYARQDGKRRWCEKTPTYALHIERLAQALPNSLFVHMLRDGRACAASDHRRWGRHPDGAIARWKHIVTEGRRQGRLIGDRYMEVRYEDVTADPAEWMRRVCSFLGVDFDERVLTASRPPRNRGRGSHEIVSDPNRSVAYFETERIAEFEASAGKLLSALGYPTSNPDGDREPGRLRRLWWSIYDARAVLFRQLRSKLTFQKRMTWSLYFARLRSMFRKTKTSRAGAGRASGRED